MRAGKLRSKVVIESRSAQSPARSPTGVPLVGWGTVCEVNAEIEPLLGREYFIAKQVASRADTRIRIRYEVGVTDALTTAMRVRDGERLYNIEAIQDAYNRHRELVLMCYSGVNEG